MHEFIQHGTGRCICIPSSWSLSSRVWQKKKNTLSVVAAQETYQKIMAHFATAQPRRCDVETRQNNTAMRVSATDTPTKRFSKAQG